MTNLDSKDTLRFAVFATGVVLMRMKNGTIEYATQMVMRPPYFVNVPGLLGGVLHPKELALEAVGRIVKEKSTMAEVLPQIFSLGFYDAVERDPRGRVVSLAHIGIIDHGDQDYGLQWIPLEKKVKLAYDHNHILEDAVRYLREHAFISSILLNFVKDEFVISELKNTFDAILGKEVDKRNFYKFLDELPVKATMKERKLLKGRPAKVYKKAKKIPFFL
jgi:8-oxo-dGTP diphosphatase